MSDYAHILFTAAVRELFAAVPKRCRVKITLWDPATGEEWEITPIGSRQTKREVVHVQCTVKKIDPEPT